MPKSIVSPGTARAKKAWKTRRKNAEARATMLTDRALKAWKTRRKNARSG